jgi:hypothetical protein
MIGVPFRRAPFALAVLLVLAALPAGCGSDAPETVNSAGVPCEHWCGTGSATAKIAGTTTTIKGGGCYDQGSAGVDARFGDWQGTEGSSDYLQVVAFRAGGPTPTPASTASPQASPGATEYPGDSVSGSANGTAFVLGTDTVVTLSADGTGSFSGTDDSGAGRVSGTFTCG